MTKNKFSKEQINELLKNMNVIRCSEKAITYDKNFKVIAVNKYLNGCSAKEIFKEAGFDIDILGRNTPYYRIRDWLRVFKLKGKDELLKEARGKNGGRPKTKGLSDTEKIERLELTIKYLKAENDFLARLRAKRTE